MPTFREEMKRLVDYLMPGNERFAKMMSNAADTQEQIAMEVLMRHDAAVGSTKEEK
jgi:hypothetical protein